MWFFDRAYYGLLIVVCATGKGQTAAGTAAGASAVPLTDRHTENQDKWLENKWRGKFHPPPIRRTPTEIHTKQH